MALDSAGTTLRCDRHDASRCGHSEARWLRADPTGPPGTMSRVGLPGPFHVIMQPSGEVLMDAILLLLFFVKPHFVVE